MSVRHRGSSGDALVLAGASARMSLVYLVAPGFVFNRQWQLTAMGVLLPDLGGEGM